MPIEMGAGTDLPWQAVWRNPEGYDGEGVIIPFRFQDGGYTKQQENDIQMWLAELSEYLGDCVKFVNDTDEKKYSKDYIYVTSKNKDGNYYKGDCWSYIGNQTTSLPTSIRATASIVKNSNPSKPSTRSSAKSLTISKANTII